MQKKKINVEHPLRKYLLRYGVHTQSIEGKKACKSALITVSIFWGSDTYSNSYLKEVGNFR